MITLLINGDDFLCRRHLQKTVLKLSPISERDFNFDRFDAKQDDLARMLAIYRTPPMMATSRTLLVENCEAFDKDEWDKWVDILSKPEPSCHLILVCEKIDKRTSFYKALSKIADVVEFKKPYANQLPQFLSDEARSLGIKLHPAAATLLVESACTDLMTLLQELEKLKLAVMPAQEIVPETVRQFVGGGVLDNIFDLTTALGEKNLKKASHLFERFHEQGEPVIRTVTVAVAHFRKLLLLKEAQNRHSSEPLEKLLGVHPFFVKDYQKQAQGFDEKVLLKIYKRLMRLSEDLRTSTLPAESFFEKFLWETCLNRAV